MAFSRAQAKMIAALAQRAKKGSPEATQDALAEVLVSEVDLSGGDVDQTSTLTRLRLHFDGSDRFLAVGIWVMTTGSIGMMVSEFLLHGPLWVGMLAGALPTFLIAVLVLPEHA